MSTYFVSDIHGEYDLFCKLLAAIGFGERDTMFILGDFLDKGKNSIKLAKLISSKPNIQAIRGNHEHSFIYFYQSQMRLLNDNDNVDNVLALMQTYFPQDTERLIWELVDYIESLPLYIETNEYICVHAGIELDNGKKIVPLRAQNPNVFLFDRRFADKTTTPQESKTVLFGHTPCHYANGTGRFIKTLRKGCSAESERIQDFVKIQLDNGVYFTGMLGCLRLEDMKEFYVT